MPNELLDLLFILCVLFIVFGIGALIQMLYEIGSKDDGWKK